jgi:murein DD-endopeptidase MepM/ murein hydrolase activator NlpD
MLVPKLSHKRNQFFCLNVRFIPSYPPWLAVLLLGLLVLSCQTPENVPAAYAPNTSHQNYQDSLVGLSLAQTSMGQSWIRAGDPGENPSALNLIPFQEQRLFDPAVPDAAYYLFEGIIGQRVTISVLTQEDTGYFADLFSVEKPQRGESWYPSENYLETWAQNRFRPVATAQVRANPEDEELRLNLPSDQVSASDVVLGPKAALEGSSQIVLEPREERFYLLRIQPRLLEGGQFSITVNANPLLAWPVKGTDLSSVWSFFGAPRDGGGRVHHGIDIFAPRGTELIAADDLHIRRIQTRERGGKTVFLEDRARGYIYYYAHMDDWAPDLQRGQFLPEGTVVGKMGNTGNAITTPPHLHFGIYQRSWRGALDPWYFFTGPAALEPALLPFGDFAASVNDAIEVYPSYAQNSQQLVSPALSDRDGETLSAQDKPIVSVNWGESQTKTAGSLRLVALRGSAQGFLDQNRRLWWARL